MANRPYRPCRLKRYFFTSVRPGPASHTVSSRVGPNLLAVLGLELGPEFGQRRPVDAISLNAADVLPRRSTSIQSHSLASRRLTFSEPSRCSSRSVWWSMNQSNPRRRGS